MKNTIVVFFFFSFISFLFGQETGPDGSPLNPIEQIRKEKPFSLRTFSGKKADWSCSGKTKNPDVISFLEKNWKEGEQSTLQGLADRDGLFVEFLWRVDPSEVEKVLKTPSSFLTGEKPDKVEMVFSRDGCVVITLLKKDSICGQTRGWTSTRDGKHPQLSEGEYKVLGFNPKGYSVTYDTAMPNQITLNGEAKERAISIHTGDISGNDDYHGCIRVGQLVGRKFGEILEKGVPVVVSYVE